MPHRCSFSMEDGGVVRDVLLSAAIRLKNLRPGEPRCVSDRATLLAITRQACATQRVAISDSAQELTSKLSKRSDAFEKVVDAELSHLVGNRELVLHEGVYIVTPFACINTAPEVEFDLSVLVEKIAVA